MTPLAYTSASCGILYAEDFDAPPATAAPLVYTPEPITVLDPALIEEARREGFEAGWQAADAAARSDREAVVASTLTAIFAKLDEAQQQQHLTSNRIAQMLLELVAGALSAALPSLMLEYGPAEVRTALQALLPKLDPNWELTISVQPDTIDELQTQFSSSSRRIAWTVDDALAAGDVRVAWRHGEFVRDGSQILQTIMPALSALRPDEAINTGRHSDATRL